MSTNLVHTTRARRMVPDLKSWWQSARRAWHSEPEQSYARRQLDLKLRPFLPWKKGLFVEVGAKDGLTSTTTLYFERHRGWRGLLVEPLPELAARCRQNRGACIVENCALVPPDFPSAEISIKFMPKSAGHDADRTPLPGHTTASVLREIPVPARTLNGLLAKHGFDRPDLLSLDVNGQELTILRGLDLKRFRPRWILVESQHRAEIEQYLGALYEPAAELTPHDVLYRCLAPT